MRRFERRHHPSPFGRLTFGRNQTCHLRRYDSLCRHCGLRVLSPLFERRLYCRYFCRCLTSTRQCGSQSCERRRSGQPWCDAWEKRLVTKLMAAREQVAERDVRGWPNVTRRRPSMPRR